VAIQWESYSGIWEQNMGFWLETFKKTTKSDLQCCDVKNNEKTTYNAAK